jgi:two-component system sensor histidine kinase KdpD
MRARTLVARAILWTGALAAGTTGMLAVRERLDKAHIALILLLLVLLGSASAGRAIGLWLAAASFIVFNSLFLPPYGTLIIADPLDWLVLIAFLITSIVAAQLLHRAQEEGRAARARATDVDRLAMLGAETLNVARAEDALAAVADVIRKVTGVATAEIFVRGDTSSSLVRGAHAGTIDEARESPDESILPWVAEHGTAAVEHRDGTLRLGRPRPDASEIARLGTELRALMLPLRVRDRTVGVLRIASAAGVQLDRERWRFLDAISYYAALGVERARLAAKAEHADALRETDRLKDALLASVSHDLRTPLTTIKALAHELRATGDERAEIIEQEVDRLNRTVADLLDLSRLNAGVMPVHPEVAAVDELLEALVQRMEGALVGHRLDVALPADDALLLARFDLIHALRILTNLVENAAKYSAPSTRIELTVGREDGAVAIRISDRGPGIAHTERARVFEPFYRPPGAPPDVGGAGLGLSIARRLAEAQDGTLVYEPRPGGGSTFVLRLPAATVSQSGESL